jgi:hypothetical protein
VRQMLPESAGYPLMVGDIGRTIHPGEEFDCPGLVPGCVPVEGAEQDGGDGAAEDGTGPQGDDTGPAAGRRQARNKETGP